MPHPNQADLSSPDAAQLIYDTCKEKRWQVDYLINNAGFGGQGDFARERTMEQDMSMIAVNIETPTMPGPLQTVYYATKAYITSWSNALWRELQGTGVAVTALMPGAMQTGFASAGGLSGTKLFSNAVDPAKVAKAGYDGMLKGKLNVISGLPGWQTPMMKLAPLFPKKVMLSFVYDQQRAGSAKRK